MRALKTIYLAAFSCALVMPASNAQTNPDEGPTTRASIEQLGKRSLAKDYPDSNVEGYALARGTYALTIGVEDKLGSGMIMKERLEESAYLTLIGVEDAWPAKESENGLKIKKQLWSCRDHATVTRLLLTSLMNQNIEEVKALGSTGKLKGKLCILGLLGNSGQ